MSRGEDHRVLEALSEAIVSETPVVLATVIATRRSVPRHAGTKMLVFADGTTVGTVGGGVMESRVIAEAGEVLRIGAPKLVDYELIEPHRGDPGVCGGEVQVYLEPYMPRPTVVVVGAGHVGRAVVDLAHWLGHRTVVVDDRAERLTPDAMPNADARLEGPADEILAGLDITPDTAVVIVSRDVSIDVAAIDAVADTPAVYVGVMGSARRWRFVRQQLVTRGVTDEVLDRIHVPIGIDLGAETVEEIAVAILGEVIGVRRDATSEE